MSILTFKGGVHPYDGKELSKDIPTRQIYPDGEVVIPVAQHCKCRRQSPCWSKDC